MRKVLHATKPEETRALAMKLMAFLESQVPDLNSLEAMGLVFGAVRTVEEALRDACKKTGLDIEEIDYDEARVRQ